MPHLQLNVWRVGVKGSGSAMRLPVPMLPVIARIAGLLGALVR
jgi:hypothetical protein